MPDVGIAGGIHMKSVTLAIVMSATIIGCSGGVDEPGNPNDEPGNPNDEPGNPNAGESDQTPNASGESEKACDQGRLGWVTNVTVYNGEVGNWGCTDFCQNDSFAYAIDLQSLPPQGGDVDDSAVNGVSLWCFNRFFGNPTGYATSSRGPWGNWLGTGGVVCASHLEPVSGAQVKSELIHGSGVDDVTMTGIRYTCLNDTTTLKTPPVNTPWGKWLGTGPKFCPGGTAVCGIQTRVEPSQGSGDDTALGGVKFACCQF
jgi:hypothetical protein